MSGAHTPGPWSCEPTRLDGYSALVWAETRKTIPVALVSKGGRISEERDANARLITAAPELLDAAEITEYAIVQFLQDATMLNKEGLVSALKATRAAIAKAQMGAGL